MAASIIVVEEVRKLIRRRARTTEAATTRQVAVPTTASWRASPYIDPMSVIIPRWEFRTFWEYFVAADAAFGGMTPGAVQESDEVYLLVDDGQPTTDVVKIRSSSWT